MAEETKTVEMPTLKPSWESPTITTLDMKKTLTGAGSLSDGGQPTS